ncbi:hypothetical protein SNE40_005557 [Patella caerulea]|uniref:Paladin n=1 Tax=Patella caerulea TaxID=87958 RepID=A0AAN8Q051_PATCE
MGSGASTVSPPSSPEPDIPSPPNKAFAGSNKKEKDNNEFAGNNPNNRVVTDKKQEISDKGCFVRTNQVAPIVIKNCREEFQHISEFKEPIVMGRVADNALEHALIRGKYFLVKDIVEKNDKLKSYEKQHAPNFHRAKGFPAYATGQPTQNGVISIVSTILNEGIKELFLFNLREEPVLFINIEDDYIPYSIRNQDRLGELVCTGKCAKDANEAEGRIRKEVFDLAMMKDEMKFYFYDDLENLKDEPHMLPVLFEDQLQVAEEVYERQAFLNPALKYSRFCFPVHRAPTEEEVDIFLSLFREEPHFFDKDHNPAMLFICNSGMGRATVGLAMGCLMLAHRTCFPAEANEVPCHIDENNPNFERGEYLSVQKLVKFIPDGLAVKRQVDVMIDHCGELYNLRTSILEQKKKMEGIHSDFIIEGRSAKEYYRRKCIYYLERYIFLICFNAYLREQFPMKLSVRYTKWMQRHPVLTQLSCFMDFVEKKTPANLVTTGCRYLVADEYIGLDVLSSQFEVKVSNFRRLVGLPVYGMAQPNRDGLACVVNHLLKKKQGYKKVVVINLRNDQVIENDGQTYSIHDPTQLGEPIPVIGASRRELEHKETLLKEEILGKKIIKIFQEITDAPITKEFTSVMTLQDLSEQQQKETPDMLYYRIPMEYDHSPLVKEVDDIQGCITSHFKDPDLWTQNTMAFVFCCRTGKSRTTFALAIAGLMYHHMRAFPYGSQPGEQERVSCPNAGYTKGDYIIVLKLVRMLPAGQQVKREVDLILDRIFETMSPMHFHLREVIFFTYNKIKNATSEQQRLILKRTSLDMLERYIFLILYNCYLRSEKCTNWRRPFSKWMTEVAARAGVYELLDNLGFYDFEPNVVTLKTRRERWKIRHTLYPFYGEFI